MKRLTLLYETSVRNVFYTKRHELLYETSDIFIRNVLYETSVTLINILTLTP